MESWQPACKLHLPFARKQGSYVTGALGAVPCVSSSSQYARYAQTISVNSLFLVGVASMCSARLSSRFQSPRLVVGRSGRCRLPRRQALAPSQPTKDSAAASPIDEHKFDVRNIGSKGHGLVATRRIRAGELVLVERPILTYHVSDQDQDLETLIHQELQKCSHKEQASFWALADDHSERSRQKTAVGIVRTNTFDMTCDDGPELGAICLNFSRLNHSCNPNVQHAMVNDDDGRLFLEVRANRDIEVGDELCTTYLMADELCGTRASRQSELLDRFNFTCCCDVCSLCDAALDASEANRSRLQHLEGEIPVAVDDLHKCQELMSESVRLIDVELGGNPALKCSAYDYGYHVALDHGATSLARDMAHEALEACILSEGLESSRTREFRQRTEFVVMFGDENEDPVDDSVLAA